MKRMHLDPDAETPFAAPLFSGAVTRQVFVDAAGVGAGVESDSIRLQLVRFAPGAHTTLHTHATDQVLVITEGEGFVGTRDHHLRVGPGDVVHVEAGEPHYHGATPSTAMAHLSVLTSGVYEIVDQGWVWPADERHE